MSETGLTLKTATECLGASSWDMEAALQLFQSVKVCWNPLGRKVAHFLTILSGYDPERGVYTTMMFSLCLSCDEINVALDPVTSRVVHVRLQVIDHIYVSACLPSY